MCGEFVVGIAHNFFGWVCSAEFALAPTIRSESELTGWAIYAVCFSVLD
jgi:hypothetical protein